MLIQGNDRGKASCNVEIGTNKVINLLTLASDNVTLKAI